MLHHLWNRHYHAGVTGSYHGDMARAFEAILADVELSPAGELKVNHSIRIHCRLERDSGFMGRQWFCERFGTASEIIS